MVYNGKHSGFCDNLVVFQGSASRASHYFAGRRNHCDMVRYENAAAKLQYLSDANSLPPVLDSIFAVSTTSSPDLISLHPARQMPLDV